MPDAVGRVEVACDHCGGKFLKLPKRVHERNFCKRDCKDAYGRRRIQKTCQTCGVEFSAILSQNHLKYCSRSCSAEAMRGDAQARMSEFWSYVDTRGPEECWPWKGNIRGGYGRFCCTGKLLTAHCVAYELTHGPVEGKWGTTGNVIMHKCDNRACCNPAHLVLGKQSENAQDMKRKGRSTAGRNVGETNKAAKLTEEMVRSIKSDKRSQRLIAAEYGVSKPLIRYIQQGKLWKHVV